MTDEPLVTSHWSRVTGYGSLADAGMTGVRGE